MEQTVLKSVLMDYMGVCVRNNVRHSATQHVTKYQEDVKVNGKKRNQLICSHNMSKHVK